MTVYKYGSKAAPFRRTTVDKQSKNSQPFLTDVKTLRERARKNIASGGVTFTYQGDV